MKVHGRTLEVGTELSLKGRRGRYKFQGVSETRGGRQVLDLLGGLPNREHFAACYPEDVKTVHRINKLRGTK